MASTEGQLAVIANEIKEIRRVAQRQADVIEWALLRQMENPVPVVVQKRLSELEQKLWTRTRRW